MNETISHNRRSIRLCEYDYSQEGLYFVTICVQDKRCLFGKITDGEMILNDVGKMVERWCIELPNHFHAIIEIMDNVGAGFACPISAIGWADPTPTKTILSGIKTKRTK